MPVAARRKKEAKLYIPSPSNQKASSEQVVQQEHLLNCYARHIAAMSKGRRDEWFKRIERRHGKEFKTMMYERAKREFELRRRLVKPRGGP